MSRRRQVSFEARVPVKRRISFTAKGKKVSFTATVPTKQKVTFTARVDNARRLGRSKKMQTPHLKKNDWNDLNQGLVQIESGLSLVADTLTLVSILAIFGALGFNIFGLVIALVYLGIWEVVGAGFSSVERRLPRPLRRLWRIAQQLVSIFVG